MSTTLPRNYATARPRKESRRARRKMSATATNTITAVNAHIVPYTRGACFSFQLDKKATMYSSPHHATAQGCSSSHDNNLFQEIHKKNKKHTHTCQEKEAAVGAPADGVAVRHAELEGRLSLNSVKEGQQHGQQKFTYHLSGGIL